MNDKKNKKYNYMMLDRLRTDCEYYLGNGNRQKKYLWAGNEEEQIKEMKRLYNSFTDDEKPEWLKWNKILEYERLLKKGEKKTNNRYKKLKKFKAGSKAVIKDSLMSVLGFIFAVVVVVVLYIIFQDSINTWISEQWSKVRF
ncbi:MAG TPA: hypothetical protein GX708_04340 [Gallicola sp.]|nr:hypothetical protein [Gallicola sp.]